MQVYSRLPEMRVALLPSHAEGDRLREAEGLATPRVF